MDKEESVEYNEAPQQRSRNAVSVSGFSWVQVTARTMAPTSQGNQSNGHRSNVSKITTPTTVQSVPDPEIKELWEEVKSLTAKLNDLLTLLQTSQTNSNSNPPPSGNAIIQQQQQFAPPQGYGGFQLSQQQLYEQHQYMQAHWQSQGMAMAQQNQHQQATPTRTNNQKRTGEDSTKKSPILTIDEEKEPDAKRTDAKDTPTKQARPVMVQSPPALQHQRMVNPYTQARQLQFRHEGSTPHFTPRNFANNQEAYHCRTTSITMPSITLKNTQLSATHHRHRKLITAHTMAHPTTII
jgi:hypothetical protein